MTDLRAIWKRRIGEYVQETQKYLQYVFTGHLVIVLLFVLGAVGMTYSEWLETVPATFPAAPIVAGLIGATLMRRTPVTLLREADAVYFLPLEGKLSTYTNEALKWTRMTKLFLPLVGTIVLLPLLRATGHTIVVTWSLIAFVVLYTLYGTRVEFAFRHLYRGEHILTLYAMHFAVGAGVVYSLVEGWYVVAAVVALAYVAFTQQRIVRNVSTEPFPFAHFIELEQRRMMSFYRFANYFTDVPHVKGGIRRRSYMSWLFPNARPFDRAKSYRYLVMRQFVRTDDLFRLYLRLTALMVLGVAFIETEWMLVLFVGALQYALVSQLIVNLRKRPVFSMDQLFPITEVDRRRSIDRVVRLVVMIEIGIVATLALVLQQSFLTALVVILVGNGTFLLEGRKK